LLDVHRSWRRVKVTDSRAAVDFAACMRELADVHFPKGERIRVVLDNLSTHTAGALYQAFPAAAARRILRRLEFHYVPKHASWLNMVEIESVCCAANAWTDASPPASSSNPKSQPGIDSVTPHEPACLARGAPGQYPCGLPLDRPLQMHR
jgi:DDE superfamily endonuclease